MGFTLRLVESSSTAIVSSVSGIVIPELNNTVISCRDGIQGQGEQQAAVMVFGMLMSHYLPRCTESVSACITLSMTTTAEL